MLTNTKDRLITILIHVLVWVLLIFVLFMYPPLAGAGTRLPTAFWIKQLVHIILMITAFYLNSSYLVPRLLIKEKRIYSFTGCLAVLSIVCSFLLARVDIWFNLAKQLERAFGRRLWSNLYIDFFGLMTTMLVLGISTSVTIIQHWHRDAKIRQEFESHRAITELSFLKAQINPHFFFNTLNSIFALTFINVETSRTALLKLSRMMRYLLYETPQNVTLLSKELEFIRDYVGIMKLRLKANTTVIFNLPNDPDERTIAPMILLPFVENAFKHGIDDLEPTTILLDIQRSDEGLELTIKNNIVKIAEASGIETSENGIGLVNTRRRLDLLYKDNYTLNIHIDKETNEYNLHLKINLV